MMLNRFSFMFTRKSLFILTFLILGGGIFFAVQSSSTQNEPQSKYEKILQLIAEMLEDGHFAPRKIDDDFSRQVFKKYLKTLDPDKMYFLASDIEKFKSIETKIDDELKGDKLTSFFIINEIYKKRVSEVSAICKIILSKPFDFNIDEYYAESNDKTQFPKNESERVELWRKRLKYEALERFTEMSEQKDKKTSKSVAPNNTNSTLSVLFDFDNSDLLATYKLQLDSLTRILNENPGFFITVKAYTDSKGTRDYNLVLSKKRANTIKEYLTSNNIKSNLIKLQSLGKCCISAEDYINGIYNEQIAKQNRRAIIEINYQSKKKTDEHVASMSSEELEKNARTKVEKAYNRIFERFSYRFKDDDRFHWLVNDISETMDPHTNYYPPVEKRSFDEQMSGEFFGIGASLQEDDGNIKIATIVTGSPAFKSGQLSIGDYILKVAQGDEEPQDLTGYAVEDAVKIIRGKKGTQVKLTIKKSDGTTKVVSLVREKINLEDAYAKSVIINGENSEKIGYIYLPEFYANFQDPNGARCAVDIAKEILKLKEEKISGIILDLRTNGGGSLMDVVQMVGFFIDEGPVVQVKSRDEAPSILRDRDKGTLWDGPLVVMVNEFSASASEIFAAAIQDYKRGIVVGSSSTFGKGTVQRNIELDRTAWLKGTEAEFGSLKLTIQKFYRITGASTQLKGVAPDIVLPDQYEYLKIREKHETSALPWDEINSAVFKNWEAPYNTQSIIESSQKRISDNSSFGKMQVEIAKLEKYYDEKRYALRMDKFKLNKSSLSETVKQIDTLMKLQDPLNVVNLKSDLETIGSDSTKIERNNNFIKIRKKDAHLGETVQIMNDMIRATWLANHK